MELTELVSETVQHHAFQAYAQLLPQIIMNVRVKFGSLPKSLHHSDFSGVLWQAGDGFFLMNVPNVARYMVEGGGEITIDPVPSADPKKVARFLRMAPLAALFYQQGFHVLHASVAVRSDRAIMVAGDSGAGKSTLLWELLKRGWWMLSDDLAVVSLDEENVPYILPLFPQVTLWADVLEHLKEPLLPQMEDSVGRCVFEVSGQFMRQSKPLTSIYWLGVHKGTLPTIEEVRGAAYFRALGLLSYNTRIADALLNRTAFMRLASAMVLSAPLRHIKRPHGTWSVVDLANCLEGFETT